MYLFDRAVLTKQTRLEKLSLEKYKSYSFVCGLYSNMLYELLSGASKKEEILARMDEVIRTLESV